MKNYRDGWTSEDWDTLTESSSALFSSAAELDNSIRGGGGGFSPSQLLAFTAKIEEITKQLNHFARSYY